MTRLMMIFTVATLLFTTTVFSQQLYRLDHTVVEYTNVDITYAAAIAMTVESARQAAVDRFGYDMPPTIRVTVTADPKQRVRLFNDGQDRFSLTVRRERDLMQPTKSGIFHIYGLCHEIAHLAMYRPIRDHSWMTSAAAEGWAHYLGSQLVDAVYEQAGEELWPDAYDYRVDGIARLNGQLAGGQLSDTAGGAGLWKELVEIAGNERMAAVFAAWGDTEIDSADPGGVLRKVLLDMVDDDRAGQWWNRAEPTMIFRRLRSDFSVKTIKVGKLLRKPMELGHDDNKMAGKQSSAGGGHAVDFQTGGGEWYLTQVRIHGSRYGYPKPPAENFHVYICDGEGKQIADIPFAYGSFKKGNPKWVLLRLKQPTQVPSDFTICVSFNPTGTKGVFVSHDGEATGNSRGGLPGKLGGQFDRGDWMIRVMVDQPKSADALHEFK